MRILIVDNSTSLSLQAALRAADHQVIDLAAPASDVLRFDSQAVGAAADGAWNLLFPMDTTRFRKDFPGGKITLSRAYLSSFVKNWERMGKAALPVDYWHDDESPQSIASGWIEELELRAEGLFARIKWTTAAKAKIAADELRFLSPSFTPDGFDTTTGQRMGPTLMGAALLNKPFLFDLPRVAAGRDPSPTPPPQENHHMLRTLLLSIFALPEITTDEVLADAVRKMKADGVKFAAELSEKIELTSKPLKLELATAREQVVKLEADVTKLQTEKKDTEIGLFLTKLESEKKLLPANRESAKEICLKMGMDFATKHFASAAPIVPTGTIGFNAGGGTELTAEQVTNQVDAELARIQKEDPSLTTSQARKRLSAEKPELLKLASQRSAAGKPAVA